LRLSICLSVCMFVCRQNAHTQFSQKQNNLELWSLSTTYRKSYMGFSKNIIRPLKFKMAEINHLENRHDVIFLPRGQSNLDEI